MTKIAFDAAYDLETLRQKTTVELREIWMNLCSPPALKEHMIRDIIHFQKKHKSAILKLEDRRSITFDETEFSGDHQGRSLQLSDTQSMPTEGKFNKPSEIRRRPRPSFNGNRRSRSKSPGNKSARRHSKVRSRSHERDVDNQQRSSRRSEIKHRLHHNHIPDAEEYETDNMSHDKMDSKHHSKHSSQSSGFLKWITGSDKVENKSDQDRGSMTEKEARASITEKQKNKSSLKSNPSVDVTFVREAQNFSNLDIMLGGLDVIADRDKGIKPYPMSPEESSEFIIKTPSKRFPRKQI